MSNGKVMPLEAPTPRSRIDAEHRNDLTQLIPTGGSAAMQIMLNEALFDRTRQIASFMSKARGLLPPHLIGEPDTCFGIVMNAMQWKLNPYMVGASTFLIGGKIGYEGKLITAILENSDQFEGPIRFEHFGDWEKLAGQFEMKSGKNGPYPARTWEPKSELIEGLGVTVFGRITGEQKDREWSLNLNQCWPLNSTLWATDPKTQICYTAVRRFANLAAPGILMGLPFDRDEVEFTGMKDVTPVEARPKRKVDDTVSRALDKGSDEPKVIDAEDVDGDETVTEDADTEPPKMLFYGDALSAQGMLEIKEFVDAYKAALNETLKANPSGVEDLIEANSASIAEFERAYPPDFPPVRDLDKLTVDALAAVEKIAAQKNVAADSGDLLDQE